MPRHTQTSWWHENRWTLGIVVALCVANAGLLCGAPAFARTLVGLLEYDRGAILHGQWWRLVTGNLVHWSPEHFLLDAGAFLFVGVLYERHLRPAYPWLLLASALAVGCGAMVLLPEMQTYRGLSGVASGQFAAALCAEATLARRDRSRWLWLAPVAAVFAAKILFEIGTGQMFFATQSLGNIGVPVPLSHAAGIAGALGLLMGLHGFDVGPWCRASIVDRDHFVNIVNGCGDLTALDAQHGIRVAGPC
jgi:rhomboid family GlyGly-CTERM serine protease